MEAERIRGPIGPRVPVNSLKIYSRRNKTEELRADKR